jgi:hypothetical protein
MPIGAIAMTDGQEAFQEMCLRFVVEELKPPVTSDRDVFFFLTTGLSRKILSDIQSYLMQLLQAEKDESELARIWFGAGATLHLTVENSEGRPYRDFFSSLHDYIEKKLIVV